MSRRSEFSGRALSFLAAGYLGLSIPTNHPLEDSFAGQGMSLIRAGALVYHQNAALLDGLAQRYFADRSVLSVWDFAGDFADAIPYGPSSLRIQNQLFEKELSLLSDKERETLAFFIQSVQGLDYRMGSSLEGLIGSTIVGSLIPKEEFEGEPFHGGSVPLRDLSDFLNSLASRIGTAGAGNDYHGNQRRMKFVDAEQLVESMLPLVRQAYEDGVEVMMFVDRGAHSAAIGVQELLDLAHFEQGPRVMNFKFCGYDKITAALEQCGEGNDRNDALTLLVDALNEKYTTLGTGTKVRGYDDWITSGSTRQVFIDAMAQLGIDTCERDFVGLVDTPTSDASHAAIALLATDFTPNTGGRTWRDILEFHGRQLEIGITYGIDEGVNNADVLFRPVPLALSQHAYRVKRKDRYGFDDVTNMVSDLTSKYAIMGNINQTRDYAEIHAAVRDLCEQYNGSYLTHTRMQEAITDLVPFFYTRRIQEGARSYVAALGNGDLEVGKVRLRAYLEGKNDPTIAHRLSRFSNLDSIGG